MPEVGVNTKLNFPKSPLISRPEGRVGYVDVNEPRVVNTKGEPVKVFYRPDDPPEHQPRPATLTSVKIFDLSKEEDVKDYETWLNKVGQNPYVTIRYTERHWTDATNNWKVLMEFCEAVMIANSPSEKIDV
jgi:hypothetical protein